MVVNAIPNAIYVGIHIPNTPVFFIYPAAIVHHNILCFNQVKDLVGCKFKGEENYSTYKKSGK